MIVVEFIKCQRERERERESACASLEESRLFNVD